MQDLSNEDPSARGRAQRWTPAPQDAVPGVLRRPAGAGAAVGTRDGPGGGTVMATEFRVTADRLTRLKTLWEYPAPFLEEKLLGKGVFGHAEEFYAAFLEFKRYVALVIMTGGGVPMMSPKVDEVWHQFILFTEEYARFCNAVLGHFMHHRPRMVADPRDPDGARRFIALYGGAFGPLPPIWGSCGDRDDCDDCKSSCNDDDDIHCQEVTCSDNQD